MSHEDVELEKRLQSIENRIENLSERVDQIADDLADVSAHSQLKRLDELEDRISGYERDLKKAEDMAQSVAEDMDSILVGETEIPEDQLKSMIREVVSEELSVEVSTS